MGWVDDDVDGARAREIGNFTQQTRYGYCIKYASNQTQF